MNTTSTVHIVLVHPEIPQNTGNIGRLCVNTDSSLHLIEPLGFSLDESRVRRAGLDYWKFVRLNVYPDWQAFLQRFRPARERMFFLSTRGRRSLYACRFREGDVLVFGNETRGLPPEFYKEYSDRLFRIPMPGEHARSFNLANAVAISMFEALRQIRFRNSIPEE